MFARIIEFTPNREQRDEIASVMRREILPILKSQPGFLEILPFEPENNAEAFLTVTLWAEKRNAERYEREVYPKVEAILKPYLQTPISSKHYTVQTALCHHFVEALTA
jgi:hypothetical protein